MEPEILRHLEFGLRMVPGILVIVLASSARKLMGKGWLIASVTVNLLLTLGYEIVPFLRIAGYDLMRQWYAVLGLVGLSGTACFAFFLFSYFVHTRMNLIAREPAAPSLVPSSGEPPRKLDAPNLFFSFYGRIPRSAFWIAVCILLPMGWLLGLAPFLNTEGLMAHVNLPCIVFWLLYACLSIPHIWISFALYTKRWHDCDKSGWMTLILLLPVIGVFWFYGYLGFVRGTDGSNGFGEDPIRLQPDPGSLLGMAGNP